MQTIMSDTVERVGIGGSFLGEKEASRRLRAGEHWVPTISTRLSFDAWQATGRREVDTARQRVREILSSRAGGAPHLTGTSSVSSHGSAASREPAECAYERALALVDVVHVAMSRASAVCGPA